MLRVLFLRLGSVPADPGRALGLYVDKLVGFWWGSDVTGLLYPQLWLFGYRVWYIAILIPAASGTWRGLREPKQQSAVALVLITLLVVSLTQAVFYVEGRHRLAVEPLLLILSGAGLAGLAELYVIWFGAGQARVQISHRANSNSLGVSRSRSEGDRFVP